MNEEIEAKNVRLIDANGEQAGIVSIEGALEQSKIAGLDLVEISPDAEPPVCKIMDYGKKLFEVKKQKAVQRKKQKNTQVKEMKFRPGTDKGDYQIKLRNMTRFLENGDKAKVTLRFRGREMAHQELGRDLLVRVAEDTKEIGKVENMPKIEGRQMVMLIGPLPKS